jgi:hypothetical protein
MHHIDRPRTGPGRRGGWTLRALFARELRGGRKILLVEDFSVTHMTWNPVGDHYHPTDVTYVKPDGSEETTAPDRLPFAIEGDLDVEGIGVVVRSGVCTRCGQRLMPAQR